MSDILTIRQTLLSVLASQFPNISFDNNILDKLVVQPASYIYQHIKNDIETHLASIDLSKILEGDVDENVALSFIRGLGVNVSEGSYAAGSAFIIVSAPSIITVPKDIEFTTSNNLNYVSTSLVRAIPSEEYRTSPDDQLLKRVGSYWAFEVPLRAAEVGTAYNIQENTEFTTTLEIPNLYKIYSSFFSGGYNPETAKDAAKRITGGLNLAGIINNERILALLKTPSDNPYYHTDLINTVSVCAFGANDLEMQRDRRGILPVSIGGKLDIYVRTSRIPTVRVVRVTARLIDINVEGKGIWEFEIPRTVCPAAYDVTKVRLPDSLPDVESYEILYQTRAIDLSPEGFPFIPDIASAIEGAFTPFQKLVVGFVDTDTPVEPEEIGVRTKDYYASVRYMPAIDAAQKYLSCDRIRPIGLDILVKSPFLCLVFVKIYLTNTPSADIAIKIKEKISNAINLLDFGDCIYGSNIASAARSVIPSTIDITGIEIGGSVLLPDSSRYSISYSSNLCIPSAQALLRYGISARNTALIQYPDNISIVVS